MSSLAEPRPHQTSARFPVDVLGVALTSGAYAALLLGLKPEYQPGADSHYHFEVAREIARGIAAPDVARGLPFTVLRDMPVDHYWGYHVLLAPFGLLPDAELGMKAATVFFFLAVFVSMHVFLRSRGVAHAWAWALLPMCFSTQDWRYLQLRGGQLVLPLLFAMTHFAFFEDRARLRRPALFAISYVALLSYHGGVVLLPFHVAGVLASWALRRPDRVAGRAFEPAITAAGMALGLTLNPYFDARASTWRFFAFHVFDMGGDRAHLYDDLPIAEFHGFPARLLASHPEWLLLLAATAVAVATVSWRCLTSRPVGRDAVVLAGMALAGVALTARAMRLREYSVPIAFALLAVLAPRPSPHSRPSPHARAKREIGLEAPTSPHAWRFDSSILAAILFVAIEVHGADTLPLIERHLPTHEYRGALSILEKNGDRPILNIAEADYGMLRWEYDRVVCVQALSRYFIYPYKELFHDVWELHDRADTSPETVAILNRFRERGVRLVAVHHTHAMARFAEVHPEVLRPVFRSPVNEARIYELSAEPTP